MEREFKVRTDLAVELEEDVKEQEKGIRGIRVIEDSAEDGRIKITRVLVENEEGKRAIGKEIGCYITLESQELAQADTEYHREMSVQIAKYVKELLPKKKDLKVLVVGLGNRDATPDSLGPRVVDNICITRRITEEIGEMELVNRCKHFEVSGIIPGVLAQTGMESAEIIKGIVEEIKPDVVLAIDSLAARNTARLNTTIQISNTGIHPGSGVGNHRKGLTEQTIGVPVIAIGIPTVVDAVTIVNDTFENLLHIFGTTESFLGIQEILNGFTCEEKYELMRELTPLSISTMYVTPKDVDETIKYISYTISEGLNIIWSENI